MNRREINYDTTPWISEPLESHIQKKFLDAIDVIRRFGYASVYAVKVHGGTYSSGQPDVLVCHKGKMFQIEFKRPGQVPTKRQEVELERWKKAGAVTMVATDWMTPLEVIGLKGLLPEPTPPQGVRRKTRRLQDIPESFNPKGE